MVRFQTIKQFKGGDPPALLINSLNHKNNLCLQTHSQINKLERALEFSQLCTHLLLPPIFKAKIGWLWLKQEAVSRILVSLLRGASSGSSQKMDGRATRVLESILFPAVASLQKEAEVLAGRS